MLQTSFETRVTQANLQLVDCQLCEHRCRADRLHGERGPCKAGTEARVFRHRIEYGEETELIPSHLFYTSGCDLRCAFCIAEANAFNPQAGTLLTVDFLREAIDWGRARGAQNVQFVGGEPTIHLPAILSALSEVHELPRIVWKSDFYFTPTVFDLLDGVADVYVADFKFGNDVCAKQIASVDPYVAIVTRNLLLAQPKADLIVRHLLLPGHMDCCYRPIVRWMAEFMPSAKFSLRDGYLPRWRAARDPQLNAVIDAGTARAARGLAREAGLNLIH
jgi:putative pyruvate formate lyase activating enzyme